MEPPQALDIGPFRFILLHDVDDMDVCRYHVKLRNDTMDMTFIGIDSQVPCGPSSNVDFVRFIWTFKGVFGFRRHALTFLPGITNGHTPRLLCLRHYRFVSMGWASVSGSVPCRDTFRYGLHPLTGCLVPDETCACHIFRRQPPTLRDIASHVAFTLSCNLDRFELTRNVPHAQYV
jgi:hypothetical protein